MMENHSYDNKLGVLCRRDADGFRIGTDGLPRAENPYANGDIQHAFRMPTTCQLSGAPSQTWLDSHTQFDNGCNDGFVVSGSGPVAMGYWEQADQPFYYSLAKVFPIADRYFSSLLGQTYPNRRYLISATSIGMVNDTPPAAKLTTRPTGPSSTASTPPASPGRTTTPRCPPRAVPGAVLQERRHQGRPHRRLLHTTRRRARYRAFASSNPTTTPSQKRTRRTSRPARPSPPRSSTPS